MKEIGGYMDFEQYHLPMLHENAIKLNSGRSCLAYLIKAKCIKRILLPDFMCDSVIATCKKYGVKIRFYSVGIDLKPENVTVLDEEWFYVANYYGQLTTENIYFYYSKYERLIIDNAQAYFEEPLEGVNTIYTCRKFFGVPDGGILYTDHIYSDELKPDESFMNMIFLLGRYERTGTEFYSLMVENNQRIEKTSVKRMSKLTENLLHSIDYEDVKKRRTKNFQYLHNRLGKRNLLCLREVKGAFAYPFFVKHGIGLRERLIKKKVYVPILWPNVQKQADKSSIAYRLAVDLLPLPCDQRYGVEDMDVICNLIETFQND